MSKKDCGASLENVELFLEEDLWIDIRSPDGVWREGIVEKVKNRQILIKYVDKSFPLETLDVDKDYHRLAELHQFSTEPQTPSVYKYMTEEQKTERKKKLKEKINLIIEKQTINCLDSWERMEAYYFTVVEASDEGEVGSLSSTCAKFSLNDPFSLKMIKFPAKGKACMHLQVFDLETFVTFYDNNPFSNMKCSICKLPLSFEDIIIDGFVRHILESISEGIFKGRFEKGSFKVEKSENKFESENTYDVYVFKNGDWNVEPHFVEDDGISYSEHSSCESDTDYEDLILNKNIQSSSQNDRLKRKFDEIKEGDKSFEKLEDNGNKKFCGNSKEVSNAKNDLVEEYILESTVLDIINSKIFPLSTFKGIGPTIQNRIYNILPISSISDLYMVKGLNRKVISNFLKEIQKVVASQRFAEKMH